MMKSKTRSVESFFWAVLFANIVAFTSLDPALLGDYTEIYIYALKICLIGQAIYALYLAFKFFRHLRTIEDTPTSKIRSCAQGFAELEGTQGNVEGCQVLGHLSKTKYTWYNYTIQRYQKSVGGKHAHWVTIEEGESSTEFQITDDTGTCIVKPKGAQIQSNLKLQWKGFQRNPTYPPPSNILKQCLAAVFGKYRYTENFMLPNTPIYAIGMFSTQDNKNYLTNQALPENSPFILSAIPQQKLIRKYKIKAVIYISVLILLAIEYPHIVKHNYIWWDAVHASKAAKKH